MEAGDLCELVELHGKAVYGFCHKLAKNKTDTDDLYQETFLKAVELCHRIDKGNNPKGFLISIALGLYRNKCRKHAWRQRIAPTGELNEAAKNEYICSDGFTPEDVAITRELNMTVQMRFSTFPWT